MKCCVCEREWPDEKCHTVTLTDAEKQHIRESGGTVPDTFEYCGPCWKVLSDKEMGARFIRGTIQSKLRAAGVGYAEVYSQYLYGKLLGLKNKE